MGKKFIIRRSMFGSDRVASSYAVIRNNPESNSIGGQFRFSKTSKKEACKFNIDMAKKILKSIRRTDIYAAESIYSIIPA